MKQQFLLITALLSIVFATECPKFDCWNQPQPQNNLTCIQPIGNDNFIVRSCPNNTDFCDYASVNSNTNTSTQCDVYGVFPPPQVYPGQSCQVNSDCISNNCEINVCQGVQVGNPCVQQSDCYVGYTCFSSICQPLLDDGEACEVTENCKLDSGCNKITKTCMKLFSQPEGTVVPSTSPYYEDSFCQSGLSINGTCVDRTNLNSFPYLCSDSNPCRYLQNGAEITDESACHCGFNSFGDQYCELGNDSEQFQNYLTMAKTYWKLNQEDNCHTAERGDCYQIQILHPKFTAEYYNAYLSAKRYYEIAGAENCVLNAFYPTYNN